MNRLLLLALAIVVVAAVATQREPAIAQEPLSISGMVWFDVNRDGVRQAEDYGFPARLVLRGPGGTVSVTQADLAGRYAFTGIPPGSYLVVANDSPLSQLIMTYPTRRVSGALARDVVLKDSSVSGIDFGLHRPRDLPVFLGLAFVHAAPADFPTVRAFIDGVDCTFPAGILPTDLDHATFQVAVLSSDILDGCGDGGDVITFTVNGLQANETAVWDAVPSGEAPLQGSRGRLELTVGPPFAAYWPVIRNLSEDSSVFGYSGGVVAALVEGQLCSVGIGRVWDNVLVIVPSRESKPGCGYEGARVTFAVDGFLSDATEVWHAGARKGYNDSTGEGLVLRYRRQPSSPLAGPGFAYYWIDLPEMVPTHPLIDEVTQDVIARIDGAFCGSARGIGPERVLVAVAPAELREGCGRPGATVTLSQMDQPFATLTWQPGFHEAPAAPGIAQAGALAEQPPAQLPASQISPPSVGDAGLRAP